MVKNGAHVILFSDDNESIFLIKRTDFPVWSITGGGIEEGEDPKIAAVREAKEESNFDISISDLKLEYSVLGKQGTPIKKEYVFTGTVKGGEYKPEFEGNIGEWFTLNKLPWSMTYSAKQQIRDLLKYKDTVSLVQLETTEKLSKNFHLLVLHPLFVVKNFKKITKGS